MNPKQHDFHLDTKRILSILLAGMVLAGCGTSKNLESSAQKEDTRSIEVQTTGDMEYCAVQDTYAYAAPFDQEAEKSIHIRKGVTITFTEIQSLKEEDTPSIWGQYEDGWVPIQIDETVYMEKSGWKEDPDFDVTQIYSASTDVSGYEEPSRNAEKVVIVPADTRMKFIKAGQDSAGNTWAQDLEGDWYLVESRTTVYIAPVSDASSDQKQESREESSNTQSQETPVQQIIVEKPVYIYESTPSASSNSSYILPYSSTYLLDPSDLYGLSAQELCYARNEIYARHGRMFVSSELQNYFNSQGWYYPSIAPEDFPESLLSSIETQNVQTIKNRENAIGMYYPAP